MDGPAHKLASSPGPGRASSDQKPPEWRVILGVFFSQKKMASAVDTALAIPVSVLAVSIRGTEVYDRLNRRRNGRGITGELEFHLPVFQTQHKPVATDLGAGAVFFVRQHHVPFQRPVASAHALERVGH